MSVWLPVAQADKAVINDGYMSRQDQRLTLSPHCGTAPVGTNWLLSGILITSDRLCFVFMETEVLSGNGFVFTVSGGITVLGSQSVCFMIMDFPNVVLGCWTYLTVREV